MKNQQKMHKGRVRSCLTTDQTLWKGMYAAVANESARITELQIKAAELAIKRVIQKKRGFMNENKPWNYCVEKTSRG